MQFSFTNRLVGFTIPNLRRLLLPRIISDTRTSLLKHSVSSSNININSSYQQRTYILSSRRSGSRSSSNISSSLAELGRTTMAARIIMDHSSSSAVSKKVDQKFDFFLVLDFEATCDKEHRINPQEIIEFPVLKFNARSLKVDSIYHQYILPQYHPHLTTFCTELTGIVQDMVNGQPQLPQVLQNFDEWMMAEDLLNSEVKSIFVTCGDWDLKTVLPSQCAILNLAHKYYFHRWINIKKSFADVTGTYPKGLMNMLTCLDLKHVGRHHSGIDDCHNISNVLSALLHKGYVFRENGQL